MKNFKDDIESSKYLLTLDEDTLWDNFNEVIRQTRSSKWMEVLHQDMKDHYLAFKFRIQNEHNRVQPDVSSSKMSGGAIENIAESKEYKVLTARLDQISAKLSEVLPQLQQVHNENRELTNKLAKLEDEFFAVSNNSFDTDE